jgi:glycosyltransferase involved in cell wall biosynthesis
MCSALFILMRIGLDGIPLVEAWTGVGHYTFELARALALISPEDEFYLISPQRLSAVDNEAAEHWPRNLRLVRPATRWLRGRWWTAGLPLYLSRAGLTLFHGTNYELPLWGACPTVVTFHDLSLLLYPETHEARLVQRGRRRLPLMARKAGMIITASESVKLEVAEHFHVSPEKIAAIPEAARAFFRPIPVEETVEVRRRLKIEDDFLLFVGTIEPRKNLMTLARAFEEVLRSTDLRPQLVIAGKRGWLYEELFSYIETNLQERVRFTGYVMEEELRALYSSCLFCVYPSLYEGFGLPTLEAMACGAPVITSRIPSMIETVGNAALLFNPKSVSELAEAIKALLVDEEARLALKELGLRRAAQFSWEKTARATLDVYREVLSDSRVS